MPRRASFYFYFFIASLPLKCKLPTSQACCNPPAPHSPSLPLVLCCFSFNMFYSFFLSTSYFIYCRLPDAPALSSLVFLPASCPPYLLLRCFPPGVRFLTFSGRGSWRLKKDMYTEVIGVKWGGYMWWKCYFKLENFGNWMISFVYFVLVSDRI